MKPEFKNLTQQIGIIILTLLLFGCGNISKKIMTKKMEIEFISSNYKNEKDGIIEFSRIVKDTLNYHLVEGNISFDKNYNTIQEITKNEIIAEKQIDEIKFYLKKG